MQRRRQPGVRQRQQDLLQPLLLHEHRLQVPHLEDGQSGRVQKLSKIYVFFVS